MRQVWSERDHGEPVLELKDGIKGGVLSRSVVSDSLRPHGLQPARLLCSWNSPGKNSGVGRHFPSSRDLPNPGIKPSSLALKGRFFTTSATWEACYQGKQGLKCKNYPLNLDLNPYSAAFKKCAFGLDGRRVGGEWMDGCVRMA